MSIAGWLQIVLVLALVVAAAIPLGELHHSCARGGQDVPDARRRAGRARLLPLAGVDATQRAELARLYDGDARLHVVGLPVALRVAASAEFPAAQPAGLRSGRPGSRLQHLDQLRHQHELAELRRRDDDEPSHADARPHRAQFPVGRDRPRDGLRAGARLRALGGADHRQFLGRYDARRRSMCCCRCRSSWRSRSSRSACRRRCSARSTRPRSKAPSRRSRSGRWPARRRSRSSAPMAAASSTPIPRIPSRIRTPGRTSSRSGRMLLVPVATRASPSAACDRRSAPGPGDSCRPWASCSSPASPSSTGRKPHGNPS